MKRVAEEFFGFFFGAFAVFIGGFWIIIPGFVGIRLLCEYCGCGASLASRIAGFLTTNIVFSICGIIYTEEARSEREKAIADSKRMQEVLSKLSEETNQSAPWFAAKVADAVALADNDLSKYLRTKKRPALKAAEQVKEIAGEKRELLRRNKELEYQLQFYENLFPWLEEFKTVPAPEAVEYVHSTGDDYDRVRNWLSPEEYSKLSAAEKNQRALNRYMGRKKSDWDVGIEYERYIGYLEEIKGFHVIYNGAIEGLSDMGRDIISFNDSQVIVIQCKRWAKEKEIHEKHIFQLYGSTILMQIKTGMPCIGRFVTTAHLSETARECADFLEIEYIEGLEYKDYPLIKCNVAKGGEKIYHLPFDQQYDRVQISGKKGAMFVSTVMEAERNGFRHARQWIPESFQGLPRRKAFGPRPGRKVSAAQLQKHNAPSNPPKKVELAAPGKPPRQMKIPSLKPGEIPLHPDFAIPYRERYSGKSISKEAGVPNDVWFDEDDYPHKVQATGLDEFDVYITKDGRSYHKVGCPSAKQAGSVNICSALAQGRKPCKQCKPMESLPDWVMRYQRISRIRRQCNIEMLP